MVGRVSCALGDRLSARRVVVVPIDRWFGDRWLGFKGKVLGALGVHSKIGLADRLAPPAFHPHRVGTPFAFGQSEQGWNTADPPTVHGHRSGETNTRLRLVDAVGQETLVCWWAGVPDAGAMRIALMIYWVGHESDDAVWMELAVDVEELKIRRQVGPGQGVLGALAAQVLAEH